MNEFFKRTGGYGEKGGNTTSQTKKKGGGASIMFPSNQMSSNPHFYNDRPWTLSGREGERCLLRVRVFLGKISIVLFWKKSLKYLEMLS